MESLRSYELTPRTEVEMSVPTITIFVIAVLITAAIAWRIERRSR